MLSNSISNIEVDTISFEDLLSVFDSMPKEHLEEVPFGNFQLELNLVEEVYTYSEQVGYGRYYAAFVGDDFAGYVTLMASEMLHHRGVMQAVVDVFYVAPAYRSGGVFTKLITYVEQDLKLAGIRFLTVGVNPNMPHKEKVVAYLSAQGYITTEISMTKEV
jgi:GNAT superfamily N-acetyltransferase